MDVDALLARMLRPLVGDEQEFLSGLLERKSKKTKGLVDLLDGLTKAKSDEAFDVLEHVDSKTVLDEAFRLTKPGGHVLISVPAFQCA